jgi:hypothetical protein
MNDNRSRREKIEAMLAEEPHDQFLRYSLALELDKEGDHERSLELFQGLMNDEPSYIPAFTMAGQQLARHGRDAEARNVYEQGITAAREQGDSHAEGEMREFLDELS